jgi:phospholipase/carboxylesterase
MSELKFYEYSEVKNPNYLVIFLHGYGANGENLLDLAHEFKAVLPQAHFISPNAIEAWEGGFPHSYQWFSLSTGVERKALTEIAADIIEANKILQKFIDEQLKRFNLTKKNLFIVGFSQGAMMAIYQGLRASENIAGVISFSGRVILPEMVGEKIHSKPRVCLIHGKQDSVLPFSYFLEAEKILKEQQVPFESLAINGLDHSIDMNGIRFAQNFIKKIIT